MDNNDWLDFQAFFLYYVLSFFFVSKGGLKTTAQSVSAKDLTRRNQSEDLDQRCVEDYPAGLCVSNGWLDTPRLDGNHRISVLRKEQHHSAVLYKGGTGGSGKIACTCARQSPGNPRYGRSGSVHLLGRDKR